MNTIRYSIRLLTVFCCLLFAHKGLAQTCTPTFSYSAGANGVINFTSTTVGTTSNSSYVWIFGNNAAQSGTNIPVVSNTYTANGLYTVTLAIAGCSTSTQTIVVNNAAFPPCTMQIVYTAPTTASLCNGSATVTNLGTTCGPPSYFWLPSGPNASVTANLCANTVYTVTAFSTPNVNCCSLITGTVSIPGSTCNLNANFTSLQGNNGSVTFSSTSTGTVAGTTYVWQFGDATPNATGANTLHVYTSNGIYNVRLIATNPGGCADSTSFIPLPVNTVTCGLNPSVTAINTASGNVNFTASSTGTFANSIYNWNFGDGSPIQSGSALAATAHTYLANGVYNYTLVLNNPSQPGCSATVSSTVMVNGIVGGPCNLLANFNYTVLPGGFSQFANLSSGTTGSTTYTWTFGDGTTLSTVANPASHQYTTTGTFPVTLFASNNSAPTCTAAITILVNIPCSLNASYTHTVGAQGQVNFESTTTGTNPATAYIWNFGDGTYTGGNAPTHNYVSAGAYLVSLKATNGDSICRDSVIQSINVTGLPCVANSSFTLSPTGTPQYWNATPFYPWNVSSASWDWGDGAVSNTLYTSHAYAVAGSYNICLSVTLSCGATGSTCTSYAVYRTQDMQQDMSIVYVNVTKPGLSTSISNAQLQEISYSVYPNPSDGHFSLSLPGLAQGSMHVSVYSITGESVYETSLEHASGQDIEEIDLGEIATGLYFMKVRLGEMGFTKKITVQK